MELSTPSPWHAHGTVLGGVFHGVKIIQSPHLAPGQAVMLPNGEFVVPSGVYGQIVGMSVNDDCRDLISTGTRAAQPFVTNRTVTIEIDAGETLDTLTVEKLEQMQGRIRSLIEGQVGVDMAKQMAVDVDPVEAPNHEREELERSPAWGMF
jgi:hypothetical protein